MKHLNEFAAFVKHGKHLVDTGTGLPLKALSLDAVDDNITVFFNEKQNIMFPAGKILAYFHDEKWLPLYDEGKAGILMFNPMRGSISQYGAAPITDIWKKSYIILIFVFLSINLIKIKKSFLLNATHPFVGE